MADNEFDFSGLDEIVAEVKALQIPPPDAAGCYVCENCGSFLTDEKRGLLTFRADLTAALSKQETGKILCMRCLFKERGLL